MNVAAYRQQIDRLSILLRSLNEKRNQLAWFRFLSVIAAFTVAYLLWPLGIFIAIAAFILLFGLFLRLVVLDVRNKAQIDNTNTLIEINNEEIKIAAHQFTHRDDGSRFLPASHAYAADLDIFGRASIYQYLNRTTSEQGNRVFSNWLLQPSEEKVILQRQQAARELAADTEWRQQLQAYGINERLTIITEEKITQWLKENNSFSHSSKWNTIRFLLPAFSVLSLLFCIAGIIPTAVYLGIAFIFFIVAGAISRTIMPLYDKLNKIAPQIETLSGSAYWIEATTFKSELLVRLQRLFYSGNRKSSADI